MHINDEVDLMGMILYKLCKTSNSDQSARPPVRPSIFPLEIFFDLSKGCAVTPSRVSSSKVKVIADIYENPCAEHIFSFFGLIWLVFHPQSAFGQWVKVPFSDVRRSYRTHTQIFLCLKHISYPHSPSWLILYTELLGKGCEFTLNEVSRANVNVIKADLFITHFKAINHLPFAQSFPD